MTDTVAFNGSDTITVVKNSDTGPRIFLHELSNFAFLNCLGQVTEIEVILSGQVRTAFLNRDIANMFANKSR